MKNRYQPYSYQDQITGRVQDLARQELDKLLAGQQKYIYATKRILAGSQMEVEVYPEFTRLPAGIKREKDRAAQRDLNDRNSRKECIRTINANFGPQDFWATLSYAAGNEPLDFEEAQKNIRNYIKRLNYRRKKADLQPARYVYVTEWQEGGEDEEEIRCHHHIVLDGQLPMDEVESCWKLGRRNQVRRLDYDQNGLIGLGTYITKAPRGKKKWCASVGLKKPAQRKNHRDFGPGAMKKMARDPKEIAARLEKKYPGYWYEAASLRCNPVNHLLYLEARMRKRAAPGDRVSILHELLDGVRLPCGGREIWMVEEVEDRAGRPWAKIRAGKRTAWAPAISLAVVPWREEQGGQDGKRRSTRKGI